MNAETLYQYMQKPSSLDNDSLEGLASLVKKYPYFQTARLLLLKNGIVTGNEDIDKNLSETAIFCSDRTRLFYYLNEEKYARFFPKQPTEITSDRTQTLLDSYLSRFSEEETISETPSNIVSEDYLAYLENHENAAVSSAEPEEARQLKHQDIIDSFLEKAGSDEALITPLRNAENSDEPQPEEVAESEFLTETLAKIYIKQKKYEQALTIIKRLSLNFPKKSIYFADQIRFLEYLILNEKNKKQQ